MLLSLFAALALMTSAFAEEIYPESGVHVDRSPASLLRVAFKKDGCGLHSKRIDRFTDGENTVYRALAGEDGIHGFEMEQPTAGPSRPAVSSGDELEGETVSPSISWKFHLAENTAPLTITEWPVRIEKSPEGHLQEVFVGAEASRKEYFFFPRKVAATIKKSGNVLYVTLPNEEHIEFDATAKTVLRGAFTQRARANAGLRVASGYELAFPTSELVYTGKGIWIEVVGNQAVIRTNTPDPACKAGIACTECRILADDLWKMDSTCHTLNFTTDTEFNGLLKDHCAFALKP